LPVFSRTILGIASFVHSLHLATLSIVSDLTKFIPSNDSKSCSKHQKQPPARINSSAKVFRGLINIEKAIIIGKNYFIYLL